LVQQQITTGAGAMDEGRDEWAIHKTKTKITTMTERCKNIKETVLNGHAIMLV